MKRPTEEEILNSPPRSKKPLLAWCEEFEIEVNGNPSIAELRKNLVENLYPQVGPVEYDKKDTKKGLDDLKGKKLSSNTLFDQNETIPADELKMKEPKVHREVQTPLLPVTIDELVQFWQRGFICHPGVVAYLANKISQHHGRSDISRLTTIDLIDRPKSSCKIYLDLNLEGVNTFIDHDWISPISILKRILVDTETTKESVIRSLVNSNRGFSDHSLIQLYPFNSDKGQPIDGSNIKSEVEDSVSQRFDLLDSIMGGFAVSSHMERVLMSFGKHPKLKISNYGSFYDIIFSNSRSSDLKDLILIKFLTDKIIDRVTSMEIENNEYSRLVESIRKRKIEDLEEYIKNLGKKDSKVTFGELSSYYEALDENFLVDAIKAIPKRKTKDPFMLFYAFLNKFKNVDVPASGDRQSFLFAIKDLVGKGDLEKEEAILLSFLLGYYIGYGMCWNPILKDEEIEWKEEHWYNDLLFPPKELNYILKNTLVKLKFHEQAFFSESKDTNGGDKLIHMNSKITERRSLKFLNGSMALEDLDLIEFLGWRQKRKDGTMFHHFMALRKGPSLESTIIAIYDNLKRPEGTYDQIEKGLKQGGFSLAERKVITALSNFIPNGTA